MGLLRSWQILGEPFHDLIKIMAKLAIILYSRAKAIMLHGKHTMDHGKMAIKIQDLRKDSMVTSIIFDGFFALFVTCVIRFEKFWHGSHFMVHFKPRKAFRDHATIMEKPPCSMDHGKAAMNVLYHGKPTMASIIWERTNFGKNCCCLHKRSTLISFSRQKILINALHL